jgi:hypothetical protein
MNNSSPRLITTIVTLILAAWAKADDAPAWVAPMREVHKKFAGKPGSFAQFGDSITVTMAYWSPLQGEPKNLDASAKAALQIVKRHMLKDCWRWKGPDYGNDGGQTIRWAHDRVDQWLRRLNPELALIMFGTNDLGQLDEREYDQKTRVVVRKCLDNGTIVILSTIPPRHGQLEKCKRFAEVVRKIAAEMKVPLIDYQAEILKRRPEAWDGAAVHKGAKDVYDVPTPISADGVHPSAPKKYAGDFSEEALAASGYNLRSYLTLITYGQVIEQVLTK